MVQVIGTMRLITRTEDGRQLFTDNVEATWNPENQEIRVGQNIIGHAKKFHYAVFALLNRAKINRNFLMLHKKTRVFISKIQSTDVEKKIRNKRQSRMAA